MYIMAAYTYSDAKFIEHWEILKSYNWMRRNPRKDYILSDQEWYSVPLPIKYMFNDDPIRVSNVSNEMIMCLISCALGALYIIHV